jgi:hypothetical protein
MMVECENFSVSNRCDPVTGAKSTPIIKKRFDLQAVAGYLLPDERVATCLKNCRYGQSSVEILCNTHNDGVFFGGLAACGSVWVCPVCAAKISERRRVELSTTLATWREKGGGQIMITFTLQHTNGEPCLTVLNNLVAAYRSFWKTRPGQQITEAFGIVGRIRSLEVTYGKNGWHAHIHTLAFMPGTQSVADIEKLSNCITTHWCNVLQRRGRYASSHHGLKVQHSDTEIAAYIAKFGHEPRWNASHELAKSHTKMSGKNGLMPFQLLEQYNQNFNNGKLFVEYAYAFKGKSQLRWTRGLRDLLGLENELTDEELVNKTEEDATRLAELTREQWHIIIANDIRGELLLAATQSQQSLKDFLDSFGIVANLEP